MKHIILIALLIGGALDIQAQTIDGNLFTKGIDSLYIQMYAGVNKSANENLPWSEFSQYPWSGGAFIAIGKEFTPLWGWRSALRFNHNKSRNTQQCESPDTWGWNNLGLFADATFDISDAIMRRYYLVGKEPGRFNLKAFVGVGAAYTFGFDNVPLSYQYPYNRNSRVVAAFRAGLNATYKINRQWRLGLELSQTMFADQFNGVKATTPLDGRTNLKVGVTYIFKRKEKARPEFKRSNPLKVVPELPFVLPEDEGDKERVLSGRAFIDFIVDRTEIRPDYRRNSKELKRIIATIDSVLFDKTIRVKSITLHGYASPESPYSHNVELSLGRVAALKGYLQKHYNLDSSIFTLENTPEDWQNLRNYIEAGNSQRVKDNIWYESLDILETPEMPDVVRKHREELLHVIDLQIDEDKKELELKKVGNGEPYNWLLKYVYPGLRHTDYVIEYVISKYPAKEGRRLIYSHPEALSLNEMHHVANSYPAGSDGWLDALLIAARQYPENQTANLNAACACVKVKRLVDAKRYLSKAGDSAQAHYLNDIICAMEGKTKWEMENGKVVLIAE